MANEAVMSPPFFTDVFFQDCYDMIQDNFGLDLNRDINITNALEIYMYLVGNIPG